MKQNGIPFQVSLDMGRRWRHTCHHEFGSSIEFQYEEYHIDHKTIGCDLLPLRSAVPKQLQFHHAWRCKLCKLHPHMKSQSKIARIYTYCFRFYLLSWYEKNSWKESFGFELLGDSWVVYLDLGWYAEQHASIQPLVMDLQCRIYPLEWNVSRLLFSISILETF